MNNQILNIKGNLVILNLDKTKFQDDGVIIYVEGNILTEQKINSNYHNYGIFSRESYIDQNKFLPIKSIRIFTHQENLLNIND